MPRNARDLPRGERSLTIQGPRGSGAGRSSGVGGSRDVGVARLGGGSAPGGVSRVQTFAPGVVQVQASSSWGLRALAQSFGQLGQLGEQIMDDQFKQRAKEVEREQSLLGITDTIGVELDQLQLPTGDSIGDEAYRRSAILAARAKVDVAAFDDVEELAKVHRGKPEEFRKALFDRAQKFVGKLPEDLRPEAAQTYARQGQQRYFKLDDERRDFERDQNRASIIEATELHQTAAVRAARDGDWNYASEELAKLAELTAAAGPVELGGSGALSLVEIEKQSQAVNDSARENFIQGWVDRSDNPQAVIDGIRSGETGNPILDDILAQTNPEKLDPLVNGLEVEIRRQQGQARMEARQAAALARSEARQADAIAKAEGRAALANAKGAVGDAVSVLLQGKEPPNLAEVAKLAGAYPDLTVKLENAITRKEGAQQFATLPETERIDTLNEMASIETMSLEDVEYVDGLRKRHESIVGNKDKVSAAVEAGIVEPTPLDLNDPTSVQTRIDAADVIEQTWGVKTSGLRTDEVDALTESMKEMTVQEQAATLGRLSGQMGDKFQRVLPQIADKEPATAMAASVADKRPDLGARILGGQKLLKDGLVQKAEPSTYSIAGDDKIGQALVNSPSQAGAVREAAQALEAEKRFATGKTDKDAFDEEIYRESIDEVTGGIYEFNDSPIVAPEPGLDEDTFAEIIGLVDDEDLSVVNDEGKTFLPVMPGGGPMTPEAFKKYGQLQSVGQGRYIVKMANGFAINPLTNEAYVFDWASMTKGAKSRAAAGQRARREGLLGLGGDDAADRRLGGGSGLDRIASVDLKLQGGQVPLNPSVGELMRRLLGRTMTPSSAPIPAGADVAAAQAFGIPTTVPEPPPPVPSS